MTGHELRHLREQLGLTQRELAELIGMHPNTVACMERDDKPISRRTEATLRLLQPR
jgi:transcriptional regulator with XRE-family HTH domain